MKNQTLAEFLKERSAEICKDNACTDDEHNCESYAYIRATDMALLDICASDYFAGCSARYAAIPLPWNGTQEELKDAVESDCDIA